MWRKNRAIDPETGCIGVDLNRNWGYEWGGLGTSDDPCDDPKCVLDHLGIFMKSYFLQSLFMLNVKRQDIINLFIIHFSSIYRGPMAFSEPETSAVRDFINEQKKIQAFMV